MGFKCRVPACRSGYQSDRAPQKPSMFEFPFDPSMKCKWIRAIHRENFEPSKSSRVCSLHFTEDDYQTESADTNVTRVNNRASSTLIRRKLKKSAVPHVFPNCPSYLSSNNVQQRATMAESSSRLLKENAGIQHMIDSFFKSDQVSSISDLKCHLKSPECILPGGYLVSESEQCIVFLYFSGLYGPHAPAVKSCVRFDASLTVEVFVD